MEEKGTISIHSENIFPIIKKFLYSDHEIFLRELVSNAVDATQKLKHLASINEFQGELGDLKVKVTLNEEAKTITISDNGIGMTADEIKKYINQIAFSGATEFVEKYKDKESTNTQQIIGHFGLGFYSAYMVADLVEIQTKSHTGAESAKWTCDGSTNFEISTGSREERGTDIILYVGEEGKDFLSKFKLEEILTKYCRFLPIEIEFDGKVINETKPLWTRQPSELTDEDYKAFYKSLYPMSEEPLFWIHLNVDYPFNLTGVLYFPKIKNDFDVQKNRIHLYSRQVFITDEVREIVPEFLTLLHGVIDSPDIPLNVSRSFLQADSNVKKINSHITKKVADKLSEMFNNDRKAFEEKWEDLQVFVKYGMISEDKFEEKAEKFCLVKNLDNQHFTFEEYKEKIKALQTDKNDKIVALYTNDPATQDTFIQSAKNKGYDVLILNSIIDPHFISKIEYKIEKFDLRRIDADVADKLIDKGIANESILSETDQTTIKGLFEKIAGSNGVKVEAMSPEELPVTITLPEFMRRMKEMSRNMGMPANLGGELDGYEVYVNANHPLVQKMLQAPEADREQLARQTYDLALLSQGMLKGSALTEFIKRSVSYVN